MRQTEEDQIKKITKQFPQLETIPKEERLDVLSKARKHPLVWGTGIVLFIVWMYFAAPYIIGISGHTKGNLDLLSKLLLPVFLPFMGFLLILFALIKWSINKVIIKRKHTHEK